MKTSIEIEGMKEFVKAMDELPNRLQRQTILPILRKAGRPVIRTARSKLLSYGSSYGNLAKSIGNITARRSKHPIIYVGPRVRGKWKNIGYIAHWVEYGVSGVKTANKGTRSYEKTDRNMQFAKWVGKIGKGGRYRKDQPPRPFMRPAIDSQLPAVKSLMQGLFTNELDKQIQRKLARIKK